MPAPFTRNDSIMFRVAGTSNEVQHLTAIGTIPGVVVLEAAARNMPGAGRLRSVGDGTRLSWRAPGSSTFGAPERIEADTVIQLEDGEDTTKYVRVQVYKSWLAIEPTEARVYLADRYENAPGHDDVTAAEASTGNVEAYVVDIANVSASIISDFDVWLQPDTPFHLEIGTNGTTWQAPVVEANALRLPDLPVGGTTQLHIRRTVAANEPSNPDILTWVRTAFNAL